MICLPCTAVSSNAIYLLSSKDQSAHSSTAWFNYMSNQMAAGVNP